MDNSKGWLVGLSAVALGAGIFFYFKNRGKKETEQENKAISDLTTSTETEQAALLKKYLNVTDSALLGWSAGSPYRNNAQEALRVCLQITNWNEVGKKFSALCDNKYTLNKALQDGLNDERYTKAIQFAKAKKVVTTMPFTYAGHTFPAGTIMGSLAGEGVNMLGNKVYNTVNDYTANTFSDDTELIIPVPQDMAKLV